MNPRSRQANWGQSRNVVSNGANQAFELLRLQHAAPVQHVLDIDYDVGPPGFLGGTTCDVLITVEAGIGGIVHSSRFFASPLGCVVPVRYDSLRVTATIPGAGASADALVRASVGPGTPGYYVQRASQLFGGIITPALGQVDVDFPTYTQDWQFRAIFAGLSVGTIWNLLTFQSFQRTAAGVVTPIGGVWPGSSILQYGAAGAAANMTDGWFVPMPGAHGVRVVNPTAVAVTFDLFCRVRA